MGVSMTLGWEDLLTTSQTRKPEEKVSSTTTTHSKLADVSQHAGGRGTVYYVAKVLAKQQVKDQGNPEVQPRRHAVLLPQIGLAGALKKCNTQ